MSFKVGEKVVYPHHGAAVIEKRETKVAFGEKREYLVLLLAYGDLILNVLADHTRAWACVRSSTDEEVEEVFAVPGEGSACRRLVPPLGVAPEAAPGEIYQVPEAMRNLSIRDKDKGLSADKNTCHRSTRCPGLRLTFALNINEETTEERLNKALT